MSDQKQAVEETTPVTAEKPKNIHQKMLEVMRQIQYLKKDDTVAFKSTSYKGLSEEKVTSTVRQAFLELGIVMYPIKQDSHRVGNLTTVNVTYRIANTEGDDYVDVVSTGEGADTQDKAAGKAMTYAYKYALLRTFAIPSGEDTDKIHSAQLDKEIKEAASKAHATLNGLMNTYMQLRPGGTKEKLYESVGVSTQTDDIQLLNEAIKKMNKFIDLVNKEESA
ncbi:ERF family protein [uncultured Exiguobacterium sp.]|uniref:ERF family protein n=1 Tax=uncultured Exiguobacterium sp. TaxID=202669 RepID=UPI0025EEE305|nr:ERF family protein [uncultured Exiguobacterium sp.]